MAAPSHGLIATFTSAPDIYHAAEKVRDAGYRYWDVITPFPAEAQRTKIGSEDFPVPLSFGWIFLNLNTSVAAAGANPPEDPVAAQAWVEVVMDADGRFSVGFNAIQLDNATNAAHFCPGGCAP